MILPSRRENAVTENLFFVIECLLNVTDYSRKVTNLRKVHNFVVNDSNGRCISSFITLYINPHTKNPNASRNECDRNLNSYFIVIKTLKASLYIFRP